MDLVRMKELLSQYMPGHAMYMVRCDIADRYYRNQSDVLYGPKKEDEEGHPLRNADNRIPRNFHGLIVNQKAAYAFTTPPTFDIGSSKANAEILKSLGDEYRKECMELVLMQLIQVLPGFIIGLMSLMNLNGQLLIVSKLFRYGISQQNRS